MALLVIFVGVSGAGKSSQARLLSETASYYWLSVGELLRHNLTPERHHQLLNGKLVPDSEVIELLTQALAQPKPNQICVLDGFPRTIHQAEWLVKKVQAGRFSVIAVIHLTVPEPTARDRLVERGRPDDHEGAITERLLEYKEVILPIIERFKAQGIPVHEINGNQPVEAVQTDIIDSLNPKGIVSV